MKVLVVDNDPIMLKFMSKLMAEKAFDVLRASDGLQALDILQHHKPALMFIDFVMPNIDGGTLCKIVRQLPGLQQAFIVMLSAVAAEEWRDMRDIEADVYMAKSSISKMADNINWVIENRSAAKALCAGGNIIGLEDVYPREITKELLLTKNHFELILKRMSEGIVEVNAQGRIVFANPSALDFISLNQTELLGLDFAGLFSEKDRLRLEGIFAPPKPINGKLGIQTPLALNDRLVTLEIISLARQAPDMSALAIFNDVSAFKRIEKRLRRTNAFLNGILNSSFSTSIISTDLDRNILYWNKGAENFFGFSADEVVGKKKIDILYPGSDELKQAERLRETIRKEKKEISSEIREIAKDGTEKWIKINLSPICDENAAVIGIQGMGEDVTERKQAERALKESEERFRVIFESARDGVFIKNRQSKYTLVNAAMARMLNMTPADFIDKTDADLFPSAQPSTPPDSDGEVLSGRVMEEETVRKVGGKRLQLHVIKAPLKNDQKDIIGICGIARDVTDMRVLEARLRQTYKMEAIGTLAGGIAHDFNNILASILGYTELALNSVEKDSTLYTNLRSSLDAGKRAKELVRQILAFAHHSDAEMQPVHVKQLIKESLHFMRASLPASIDIRHIIKSNAIIMADATQMQQVIMNLCTNAGHAMQATGGRLTIHLDEVDIDASMTESVPEASAGRYLKLSVSDTGRGIAPEILNKIFDPYFTTKEKGQGTGMGLAVVMGVVKRFKGFITVESEAGKGSVFDVYWPLDEARRPPDDKRASDMPAGHEHILFVDDEPAIVDMAKQSLERLGYTVTGSTSSIDALKQFEQQPGAFDLVITDMSMPHMNGDQLAKALLQHRADIPIILCTGYSEHMSRKRAEEIGVKAFVTKPIGIQPFARTIRRALDALADAGAKEPSPRNRDGSTP